MTRPIGSKNKEKEKQEISKMPSLSDNCGKCLHCIDKGFDERQNKEKPAFCPVCESDKARMDLFHNPCGNFVKCPNGHRYDILQFCDKEDIMLHRETIKQKQEEWLIKN